MNNKNTHKVFFFNMRQDILICLFLVITVLAVYRQVGNFDFINYDDDDYVYNNPHVQDGLTLKNIAWSFMATRSANWHPLTWLSHMSDVHLYGMTPGMHHLTNVIFHIANTLLLFLVFRKMTGDLLRSGFVAALFALHPVHVESVAWVSERKDVLSTFFWMMTMRSYILYSEAPGIQRYLLILVFFALGLMAKPMLVTLPFVLILLDYWPLGRYRSAVGRSAIFLEKIPLFVLATSSCAVTLLVQQSGGAIRSLDSHPFHFRIGNALVSYAGYIGKMIWPSHMSIFYPPHFLSWWEVAGACLILGSISALVIIFARQRPWLAVGWLWYIGTLVPVIGVIQVGSQAMADRYTYIPLIGLFIIIAWGFKFQISNFKFQVSCALAAIFFSILMTGAWLQTRYWANSITLFEHALDVTVNNILAHTNLGLALTKQGRTDEAIAHYSKALHLSPNNAKVHNNMGVALFQKRKIREAILHFQKALQKDPGFADANHNLRKVLAIRKENHEVFANIQKALNINPEDPVLYYKLGNWYKRNGKVNKATEQYQKALSIQPEYPEVLNSLAVTHATRGEYDNALSLLKKSAEIHPGNANVYYYIASVHAKQGNREESVEWLKKAVSKGYKNWDYLKTDSNLENIRETSYYKNLLRDIEG